MLSQSSISTPNTHLVNEIDGRKLAVSADIDHSHTWVNGELVFTDTEVIEIVSVNHQNIYQQLRIVLPLAEAISMAKAILCTQQADDEAAYEAWLEQQYQRYLDHRALVDDALAHEVAF